MRFLLAAVALLSLSGSVIAQQASSGPFSKSGPYKVNVDKKLLKNGAVCYPDGNGPWPVIVWGNGFLGTPAYSLREGETQHVASYGFVVLHPSNPVPLSDGYLKETIDAAAKFNGSGALKGKLDLSRVGVRGSSMSGPRAIEATIGDARIKACASMVPALPFSLTDDYRKTFSAPVLIASGDIDEYGSKSIPKMYPRLSGPVYVALQKGRTHKGNEMDDLPITTAWFCLWLRDDLEAWSYFFQPDGLLLTDKEWSVQAKGFE